jgi:carbamoyltransferase
MKILGLNLNHPDSSACLIIDGKIINAVEEERFTRIKHFSGFPLHSINFCLEKNNLKMSDINYISINFNKKSNILKKLIYIFTNISLLTFKNIFAFKNKYFKNKIINSFVKKNNFKGKILYTDHHLSHLSSSFLLSGFQKSIGLTIDGFGDFCSMVSYKCENNKISTVKKVYFPHSLGILYQAITQFLGFKSYGDEYKVMGLASYGQPKFLDKFEKLVTYSTNNYFKLNLKYFNHHLMNDLNYDFKDNIPKFNDLYSKELINLLGKERNKDDKIEERHFHIASSLQKTFELILFRIINSLCDLTNFDHLCLSGGCALNSTFNGKIYENTNVKKIFIQPNSGDGGGSLGSGLYWSSRLDNKFLNNKNNFNPFLGPEYSNEYIEKDLIMKLNVDKKFRIQKLDDKDLFLITAKKISEDKIIGWFQGAMEWGPRALGNRSILGNPRNKNIRDILNLKIKRRENFRPFAPSVIKDFANDYFYMLDDSYYMLNVFKAKQKALDEAPAIVHVDETARVQLVSKDSNKKFYNLIYSFYKLTGVPILLNTSFNENEPIVCNPKEAFDCFERTNMDSLILNNWIITRE